MKHFAKIKVEPTKGKVRLEYTEAQHGDHEDHTLTVDAHVHEDFRRALQALRGHLCDVCEFPESYRRGIDIRSVTIKRTDGFRSIVVTGLKDLDESNSPLVVNSPLAMPDGVTTEILDDLEQEARLFIAGKRSQMDLFSEETAAVADEADVDNNVN